MPTIIPRLLASARRQGLMGRFLCAAALVLSIAGTTSLGISSARADTCITLTGACSGGTGASAWSVTIADGISLLNSYYFTSSSTPPGPSDQGTGSCPTGKICGFVRGISGLSSASLVGQIDTMNSGDNYTGTDANVFALHYGGAGGKNEIVLVFSAVTDLTDLTLGSLSDLRAFTVSTTPLPPAAFLFGTVLFGGLGASLWRKRRPQGPVSAFA